MLFAQTRRFGMAIENLNAVTQPRVIIREDVASPALKEKEVPQQQVQAEEEKEKAREELMEAVQGSVIAKSEDGDTVRASNEGAQAASDGIVLAKETAQKQEVRSNALAQANIEQADKEEAVDKAGEEAATQKVVQEQEQVTSLVGLSSAEIERLYRNGSISRGDHDRAVERREELREQLAPKEKATPDKEDVATQSKQRETDLQENQAFMNNMSSLILQQKTLGMDPELDRFMK